LNDERPRTGYHHGDLRNALIEAALATLEAEGADRLSLRGVASAVGVSHAAPAHHFGSLKGLRTALAAVGFERFAAAMRAARAEAPDDPIEQLRAARVGYLAFAVASPALFRLMFTSPELDWTQDALCHAARHARQELSDYCGAAARHLGLTDPHAVLQLEHLVWAEAHGEAHLVIDGRIPPSTALPEIAKESAEVPNPLNVIDLAALIYAAPRRAESGDA
jgi:AcrR family transcriptional regulator